MCNGAKNRVGEEERKQRQETSKKNCIMKIILLTDCHSLPLK